MSKPKVEAIYPLTFMQQTLLMHSLHEHNDQGFLQVMCKLEGNLDVELLKEAWQQCIHRHWALRASVHWEKIKKPVQIIHPQSTLPWTFHNLEGLSERAQKKQISKLANEDREKGFNLTKAPISRVALIQLGINTWQMLWSCHHILLDGWSAALIIKDVFLFYDGLSKKQTIFPEPLPSYSNYLNWRQKQDPEQAKLFWQQQFKGFKKPVLLTRKQFKTANGSESSSHSFSINADSTNKLQLLGKRNQVTIGTIIQCCWGLLLCRYANTKDVVFGTTVSGRNTGLSNMELMAGMFTNVLPTRINRDASMTVSDWLKTTQASQSETQNFEHTTLDQLADWINWPGELPMFDSLLVFENFPWNTIESGEVNVTDFTGGITSTYPVTVIIIPGSTLRLEVKLDKNRISETSSLWICQQLEILLQSLSKNADVSPEALFDSIEAPPTETVITNHDMINGSRQLVPENGKEHRLITPRNPVELQLAKIWENIFGRSPIGVTEHFFEIGGTSILAVRLLAQIEQKLKHNLPPAALLQNPTIEGLAGIVSGDNSSPSWSALVPLRTRGNKPPIFCMHAGGGHVYFYNALAKYLDENQPVYSMQPVGLDGVSAYHESIKTMARDYLKEIQSIQPKGPYALLGTCFSNAVCLEIAHQLKKMGESISLLVIVDSGGRELGRRVRVPVIKPPMPKRLKRFVGLSFKDASDAVRRKVTKRMEKLKNRWVILTESARAKKLREMQEHLGKLYEDYFWEPCDEKVTLIRSSEYNEDPNKNVHIDRWTAIALGGLSVYVVPGEHLTLFEEPSVQQLARQLQECLDMANKQHAGKGISVLS